MSDELISKIDRLSRDEFVRLIDRAGESAVVLLEGARALPSE